MKYRRLVVMVLLTFSASAWASQELKTDLESPEVSAKEAAIRFFNDYVAFNSTAVLDAFAEDGQWCAGASNDDYPFNACYVGRDGISFLLSKAGNIFQPAVGHPFLTLTHASASSNTAVLLADEWFALSPAPGIAHHKSTVWVFEFKRVNGRLKIATFNFIHTRVMEDLPKVGANGAAL